MTKFLWRLPSRGDGRRADPGLRHRDGFDDIAQVVRAAELSGLDGLVAPYDPDGEESWIVAGGALRSTRHSRIVVEFPADFGTPVYAAKMSATLQRLSAGRLSWWLAVDPAERTPSSEPVSGKRCYDTTLHSRVVTSGYARAEEFLTVARGVWNERSVPAAGFRGTGFDFDGEYYDVVDGGFRGILSGLPFPTVYLSGGSLELSARHADVHVFAETADDGALERSVAALGEHAARAGRTVRAGLDVPVVARQTDAEAWARVHRQWRELNRPGQDGERLRLDEDRWAGFTELGHRHPIGLVGSYERVAARLRAYQDAGFDTFVLSGHPHIEEVHRAGEHLLFLADPAGRTLEVSTT
ncbi:LLM class flavin-dependent oxidoreductase [Pseudonocardia acaciae]|uniref:LLM class flavin-dependent oxidoreductase n=1 Tax=Pseudonocardia acaciae TaxID=551276 RepID=UPI00048B91BE|nr:LLM class flavin-dependent oxidoreductase [Pseudonocardia acaciae]